MNEEQKIIYSFLKSSITQLETILKDLKPYWEKSKTIEERLEYRKRLVLLKDLKKQLKELNDNI